MKKISWIIVILVIVGFSTASVLGYQNASAAVNAPFSPESAKDVAVNYILQNHKELSLTAPEAWDCQNLTPELLGGSTLEYTADCWNVTVSYPVVLEPTFTVEVCYSGESSFEWVGTVTNDGTVTETNKNRKTETPKSFDRKTMISHSCSNLTSIFFHSS